MKFPAISSKVFFLFFCVSAVSVVARPLSEYPCSELLLKAFHHIETIDLVRHPQTVDDLNALEADLLSLNDEIDAVFGELNLRAMERTRTWRYRVRAARTLVEIAARDEGFARRLRKSAEKQIADSNPDGIALLIKLLLIPLDQNPQPTIYLDLDAALGHPSIVELVFRNPENPREGLTDEGKKIFDALLRQIKKFPARLIAGALESREEWGHVSMEDPRRTFLFELASQVERQVGSCQEFTAFLTRENVSTRERVEAQLEQVFRQGPIAIELPATDIVLGDFTFSLWVGPIAQERWKPQGNFYFTADPGFHRQSMDGLYFLLVDEDDRLLASFKTGKEGAFKNLDTSGFRASGGKIFLKWIRSAQPVSSNARQVGAPVPE